MSIQEIKISCDPLAQPGNSQNKIFGAQLRNEYITYKRMRDHGELPNARTQSSLENRVDVKPQ